MTNDPLPGEVECRARVFVAWRYDSVADFQRELDCYVGTVRTAERARYTPLVEAARVLQAAILEPGAIHCRNHGRKGPDLGQYIVFEAALGKAIDTFDVALANIDVAAAQR